MEYKTIGCDVLIVGAGGAGCRAAIEASKYNLDVIMLSKELVGKAHTAMAEGGYNVAFPADYMYPIKIYQLKRGESYPAFNRYKDVELGPININLELDIDIRKAGGPTYVWELEDAYPVAFQADTMTNDSRDISEITVEFAYRRWQGSPMSLDQETSIDIGGGADINLGNVITKKIYNAVN